MTSARMVDKSRCGSSRGGLSRWHYSRAIESVKPGSTLRVMLPLAPKGTSLLVNFGAVTPGGKVYPRLKTKVVEHKGRQVRQVDVKLRSAYELASQRGQAFPVELADFQRRGGSLEVKGPIYHLSARLEQ